MDGRMKTRLAALATSHTCIRHSEHTHQSHLSGNHADALHELPVLNLQRRRPRDLNLQRRPHLMATGLGLGLGLGLGGSGFRAQP